jgi:para-nitrobenzyl esterase
MSTRIKDSWRKKKFGLALRLLLGVAAVCGANGCAVVSAEAPVVVTQDGPVKGFECTSASVPGCSGSGVEEFLGIPYAAPPVGALRWTPPQPNSRWAGVFKATNFGSICTQPDPNRGTVGSEDCLSLNIFRPSRQNNENQGDNEKQGDNQNHRERLPVMVWIHGGAYITGGSRDYDPTPLVEKGGVIVVTINYRLGFLGFFAQLALDAEDHLNANYGLMDQQLALKWVQRNIAAFGGDPSRVTIVGQSAGGISVYSHLASPTAAGLFHRAIAESGTITLFQNVDTMVPLVAAEKEVGTEVAASVGCGNQTAQCLRATAASEFVAQQQQRGSGLLPIVDGTVLTQTLNKAFASGQFNRVPVISGSNHDEYRYMVATQYDLVGHPLSDNGYSAAVAALVATPENDPSVQLLVNNKYRLSNYHGPAGTQRAPLALGALGTDYLFACGARNAVRYLSNYVPTFAYEFNDENSPFSLLQPSISFPWGAAHGFELAYLFNSSHPTPFTPAQQQLSDAMISYWTEFAKTGNPNSENAPPWPLYNSVTDQFQSLIPPTPTVKSNFDTDHQCSSLWNKL